MIVTGLGNGLAPPVYTIAVQNVAPRHQMGAATSSTVFFRSIGSTIGVALFGTLMLSSYHRTLDGAIPAGTPHEARALIMNPLMLLQSRPRLKASLASAPQGPEIVRALFQSVKIALVVGLQRIFFWSAVIMTAAVVPNLALVLTAGCRPVDAQSGSLTGTSKTLVVRGQYAPLDLDQVAGVSTQDGRLVVRGSERSVTLDLPAGAQATQIVRRWALTTEFDAGHARVLTFTHAESLEEFTVELPPSDAEVRYGVFQGPDAAQVMVLTWGANSRSYWAHLVITPAPTGK